MRATDLRDDGPVMAPDPARHVEIRQGLKAAGTSLSAVARELGVTPSTVTIVSQGYRRSHRVQTAIARHLGRNVHELFPDRYREDEMPTT